MSVRVISSVWKNSRARGGSLLVLLAIADYANDEGTAWPSIDSIARMARMGVRRTQDIVRLLQQAGELQVDYRAARMGCNLYRVQCLHQPGNDRTPQSLHQGCNSEAENCTRGGAISGLEIAPDPSVPVSTRQEPPYPPEGGKGSEAEARSPEAKEPRRGRAPKVSASVFVLNSKLKVVETEIKRLVEKEKRRPLDEDEAKALRAVKEQKQSIEQELLKA